MKTRKLLNLLAVGTIGISTATPTITLTSCSNADLYKQLELATINEFAGLCKYPHSSDKLLYKVPYESNVMKLSNYLVKRCHELTGSDIHQDIYGNIWFDIEANDESLKDAPTIALQAHMDMVFTYDPNQYETAPDPLTTPIDMVLETKNGKRVIHSKDYKTTVGGDNGIGVASILAIIGNKNLKHGKLRVILTNCEENAMQGALMMVEGHKTTGSIVVGGQSYEYEYIDSPATARAILHNCKYVLNLDGGLGNTLCVACSGAVGCHYTQKFDLSDPTYTNKFELKISGLNGGHSGGAVRQGYGNAIVFANYILAQMSSVGVELAEWTTPGTEVYNRVASQSTVKFACGFTKEHVLECIEDAKKHYGPDGENWKDISSIKVELNETTFDKVVDKGYSKEIVDLQSELLYGVDPEMEEKGYKTSSNLGPTNLNIENDKFKFKTSTYSRSDNDTRLDKYFADNKAAAGVTFNFLTDAHFHPWAGDENKKLFNLTSKALKDICGYETISEERAHGGIEPAAWSWAMKNTEEIDDGACVSIGVNVADEHEVTETIDVETIIPAMKVVQEILLNANELK